MNILLVKPEEETVKELSRLLPKNTTLIIVNSNSEINGLSETEENSLHMAVWFGAADARNIPQVLQISACAEMTDFFYEEHIPCTQTLGVEEVLNLLMILTEPS